MHNQQSQPGHPVELHGTPFSSAFAMLFLLISLGMSGVGCESQTGQLAVRSLDNAGETFSDQFTTAYYHAKSQHDLEVILVEGDVDDPTRVLHLRMLWQGRAGRTPLDPRATNVTLRFAVINDSGVGVYAGAGFMDLQTIPGSDQLIAELSDSSIRLQDKSEGFTDELGLASASGQFTAERDGIAVSRVIKRVQVALAKKLGHPRFVENNTALKIFTALKDK